ncbi:zinc finger domain-containing protein [Streptomyces sp. NPDC003691]
MPQSTLMKQSRLVSDDFKRVESRDCPMFTCAAPAGSPCRTGKRKVAIHSTPPASASSPRSADT